MVPRRLTQMKEAPFANASWPRPERRTFSGEYVSLKPLNPDADVDELYRVSHHTDQNAAIWTYLPYGPFPDRVAMHEWLVSIAPAEDPIFFSASLPDGRKIGMNSVMSIVSGMGRAELGHIWYSPEVHRTKVNTEAAYLFLRYLFDELNYRRVEWKCDSLNAPSRAAALRMGFQFEGIFRQHLIVKGRNRDTAWFSMLDKEWPEKKGNFERWLYENKDYQVSLSALNEASVSRIPPCLPVVSGGPFPSVPTSAGNSFDR